MGDDGPDGNDGVKGFKGTKGEPLTDYVPHGPQGPEGPMGFKGLKGPKGIGGSDSGIGIPGIKGVDGSKGCDGPQGPKGEPISLTTESIFSKTVDDLNRDLVVGVNNVIFTDIVSKTSSVSFNNEEFTLDEGFYKINMKFNITNPNNFTVASVLRNLTDGFSRTFDCISASTVDKKTLFGCVYITINLNQFKVFKITLDSAGIARFEKPCIIITKYS